MCNNEIDAQSRNDGLNRCANILTAEMSAKNTSLIEAGTPKSPIILIPTPPTPPKLPAISPRNQLKPYLVSGSRMSTSFQKELIAAVRYNY